MAKGKGKKGKGKSNKSKSEKKPKKPSSKSKGSGKTGSKTSVQDKGADGPKSGKAAGNATPEQVSKNKQLLGKIIDLLEKTKADQVSDLRRHT